MTYQFEVPGRPQPKQSVRFARGAVRAYQPAKIVNFHALVATFAKQAIPAPLEGAIHLRLSIVLRTPASWSKKRKSALNYATVRPDLDNSSKAFMDGMNGIAWIDDKQVVDLHVTKAYGNRDAVVVTVTEL